MNERDPKLVGKIVKNPTVLVGKPTIAGTRISVELILDKLAAGETSNEILNDYPHLTEKDISAAVSYANERNYPANFAFPGE
ncbi:MAG: hypothetical protein A3F33_01800 [Candidatus Woykebacteria bacterium RIFCSPHIGHO2_12_FULL_43_10]|uniref:Antitoxin n=1 Tax=Candidatus Woykebacteria bacterium RIFCSPHIGHO2_02_FULL_43_16b TaxID=1802601 RepID=A0A1G1WMD5_9BACT|nr:MAG: hypothetical protein A3J50_03755 [Candidatus Woykebacteria bacterium RIFCSPHIGHO2_02_FULL_43_16b]OGY29906.1 MAG: hypothetical protein A3F33_01800 [Candidatus Woykebacteria bacterium RIFCSPHIGHO2_12_FULL_43_10]